MSERDRRAGKVELALPAYYYLIMVKLQVNRIASQMIASAPSDIFLLMFSPTLLPERTNDPDPHTSVRLGCTGTNQRAMIILAEN
jgi:hypothetical protein